MGNKKLSIITINRNNAEGLKRTLDSVKAQTCQEFEHIIVDGASTDDSVKIIESYVRDISCMKYDVLWVSEPDTGIYNAMNKGIRMSHGEYLLMLNSGDYLAENDVVEQVMPELHTDDMIQGCMYLCQKDQKHLDYGNGLTKMSLYDVYHGDFLHQAIFIRREVHEKYGYYNESYRIAGDTAFFVKTLGLYNVSFRHVEIPISVFEGGGMASSTDSKMIKKRQVEYKRIETEILGPRVTKVCQEDYKKVKIYEKLHSHKWSWILTRLLLKLCK